MIAVLIPISFGMGFVVGKLFPIRKSVKKKNSRRGEIFDIKNFLTYDGSEQIN